jgi:hypothetical protein
MDGLVVVASLIDRFEADLLMAALRSEGIPVTTEEDSRRAMLGGGLLGPGTHGADPVIEVLVPAERLDEARVVASLSALGEESLPPEFRDEVWSERVSHRNRRRRTIKRWMVLGPIVFMFAAVVLILVLGAVQSLGS